LNTCLVNFYWFVILTKEKSINSDTPSSITISLRPNSVKSAFDIIINNTQQKQTAQLSIANAQGRISISENRAINVGNNILSYNCANWASGLYMLKVVLADGTRKELKIVKQ